MARVGRPPFEPNDEQRQQVETLAGLGMPQADIARACGIAKATLRRAFAGELEDGQVRLHAKLAATAAGMALAGDKTMLIFVLKTKFRWSEQAPAEAPQDTRALIAADEDPEVSDRGEAGT